MDFITEFFVLVIYLNVLSFIFHLCFTFAERFIPHASDIHQVEVINFPDHDIQKVEVINGK